MKFVVLLFIGLAVGGCRKAAPPPPPAAAPVTQAPDDEAVAAELEIEYLAAPDLYGKLQVLSDLVDAPPAAAVDVLGRLFYYEEETEVREEILHSLLDVDGQGEAKRRLLEEAIQPDLPRSLRLTAIDLLAELGDKQALPALQKMLADPDQEVRQAIDDAMNDLM
jgi:HEAT repeat protein